MMTGFLVVFGCFGGDLPLRLFKDRDRAKEFAESLTPQDVDKVVEVLFHIDRSNPRFVYLIDAHGPKMVDGQRPHRARMKSPVTSLRA